MEVHGDGTIARNRDRGTSGEEMLDSSNFAEGSSAPH